jgi:hypothetical protein
MRLKEAIRSGLFSQGTPIRGIKLPEGRWGHISPNRPGRPGEPMERPVLQPDLSSRLIKEKPQVVRMADKANKVVEKQFNK